MSFYEDDFLKKNSPNARRISLPYGLKRLSSKQLDDIEIEESMQKSDERLLNEFEEGMKRKMARRIEENYRQYVREHPERDTEETRAFFFEDGERPNLPPPRAQTIEITVTEPRSSEKKPFIFLPSEEVGEKNCVYRIGTSKCSYTGRHRVSCRSCPALDY